MRQEAEAVGYEMEGMKFEFQVTWVGNHDAEQKPYIAGDEHVEC